MPIYVQIANKLSLELNLKFWNLQKVDSFIIISTCVVVVLMYDNESSRQIKIIIMSILEGICN